MQRSLLLDESRSMWSTMLASVVTPVSRVVTVVESSLSLVPDRFRWP
jgi:hypothetical protein